MNISFLSSVSAEQNNSVQSERRRLCKSERPRFQQMTVDVSCGYGQMILSADDIDGKAGCLNKCSMDIRMLCAEQNSSNAKTESIILLIEHNIRSISIQEIKIHVLRSE